MVLVVYYFLSVHDVDAFSHPFYTPTRKVVDYSITARGNAPLRLYDAGRVLTAES